MGDPQRKGKTCLKVDRVRSQKGKKDGKKMRGLGRKAQRQGDNKGSRERYE